MDNERTLIALAGLAAMAVAAIAGFVVLSFTRSSVDIQKEAKTPTEILRYEGKILVRTYDLEANGQRPIYFTVDEKK